MEEWRVVKIFSKEGSLDVTFRNFGDIKSKTLPGWYSGYRYTESIDLQLYCSFRGKSFIKATIIESENYWRCASTWPVAFGVDYNCILFFINLIILYEIHIVYYGHYLLIIKQLDFDIKCIRNIENKIHVPHYIHMYW